MHDRLHMHMAKRHWQPPQHAGWRSMDWAQRCLIWQLHATACRIAMFRKTGGPACRARRGLRSNDSSLTVMWNRPTDRRTGGCTDSRDVLHQSTMRATMDSRRGASIGGVRAVVNRVLRAELRAECAHTGAKSAGYDRHFSLPYGSFTTATARGACSRWSPSLPA